MNIIARSWLKRTIVAISTVAVFKPSIMCVSANFSEIFSSIFCFSLQHGFLFKGNPIRKE